MLKVDGLRKHYGDLEVVRGVTLQVAPGTCFGLLGPNGAGKTTTLRCCLGLTTPDSGTIELAGIPVPAQAREARARVGVVPQFDNLDPDFTVRENILVFGRYFGMRTGVFRGGCLTGPGHSGAALHGFLAYLMRCTVTGDPYTVLGYLGKQVRDNIHAVDLVRAFDAFRQAPRPGEAYNIGGGRFANCSMLEAIDLCQEIAGRELKWDYQADNRIGDHIWWVSDIGKFQGHFPSFQLNYDIRAILTDIHQHGSSRWLAA